MIARIALLLLLGFGLLLPGLASEDDDDATFGGDPDGDTPFGEADRQPPPSDADGEAPPAAEPVPSGEDFRPTEQLRYDQEVDFPVDI